MKLGVFMLWTEMRDVPLSPFPSAGTPAELDSLARLDTQRLLSQQHVTAHQHTFAAAAPLQQGPASEPRSSEQGVSAVARLPRARNSAHSPSAKSSSGRVASSRPRKRRPAVIVDEATS